MAHSDKKMLSISLTNTCNLDCVYCYAHNDPENIQIMSKDFALWGIEHYYKEYIFDMDLIREFDSMVQVSLQHNFP